MSIGPRSAPGAFVMPGPDARPAVTTPCGDGRATWGCTWQGAGVPVPPPSTLSSIVNMPHFVGTFLIPGAAPHAVAIQDRVHTALRAGAGGDPTEAAPYPDVTMQSPIVDYMNDSARFHVWFTAPDHDAAEQRLVAAVAAYPTARDVRVEEPHTI